MSNIKKYLLATVLTGFITTSHSMDIVKDPEQIAYWAQQIAEMKKQYDTLKGQYDTLKAQNESLTGTRALGMVLNNPAIQQYIPKEYADALQSLTNNGQLTDIAQGIKDKFNIKDICDNYNQASQSEGLGGFDDSSFPSMGGGLGSGLGGLGGSSGGSGEGVNYLSLAKTTCEAISGKDAQDVSLYEEGMKNADQRIEQINNLMAEINKTTDPKGIAELQARIQGEQAQLQNEQMRMSMYKIISDANNRMLKERQRQIESENFQNAKGFLDDGL